CWLSKLECGTPNKLTTDCFCDYVTNGTEACELYDERMGFIYWFISTCNWYWYPIHIGYLFSFYRYFIDRAWHCCMYCAFIISYYGKVSAKSIYYEKFVYYWNFEICD